MDNHNLIACACNSNYGSVLVLYNGAIGFPFEVRGMRNLFLVYSVHMKGTVKLHFKDCARIFLLFDVLLACFQKKKCNKFS